MKNWFYRSIFGRLYLEILLLWDRYGKKRTKVTPLEIAQIVRQYSLLGEGVRILKKNINSSIQSRSKEEYHKTLTEMPDLTLHAINDKTNSRSQVIETLKTKLDFSNKDVKNDTDYANMLERRIKDYDALHEHINKRNALREARRLNGKRH